MCVTFKSNLAGVSKTAEVLANPLTRRKQEILALFATGKTNQQIVELLYIAIGTVRFCVHTILQKLEVRDRTQAAVSAIEKGLVLLEL
ncbi:MAG TPA: LuxR C-terminal-related transcriptional regulator, partial [Stenomitos sp.]